MLGTLFNVGCGNNITTRHAGWLTVCINPVQQRSQCLHFIHMHNELYKRFTSVNFKIVCKITYA